MSWFGETFGDSLTSLKGQISKITKEVLADDDSSTGKTETDDSNLKELRALCESKDLEISLLRENYEKLETRFKSELEVLKGENERLKVHTSGNESENDRLSQLQNEVARLTEERNHLNNCIDELQSEHETNLHQVVSMRDKYKKDFENLKKENDILKTKINESSKLNQCIDSMSSDLDIIKDKENEVDSLKVQLENVQSRLNESIREQEECKSALKNERDQSECLRKELERFTNDLEMLKREKSNCENEKQSVKQENNKLYMELESVKTNLSDMEVELGNLKNEKEKLIRELRKSSETDASSISLIEVRQNLSKLLKLLNLDDVEEKCENFNDTVRLIETNLDLNMKILNEKCENFKKVIKTSEEELEKLKEENSQWENKFKESTHTWMEKETRYRDDLRIAQEKLDEAKNLKLKLLEMEKRAEIHSESQTDDVKRLEQEVKRLQGVCQAKSEEMDRLVETKTDLEREFSNLKTMTENLKDASENERDQIKKLQDEIVAMENGREELNREKLDAEKKCIILTSENSNLVDINDKLKRDLEQFQRESSEARNEKKILEEESQKARISAVELEKSCLELKKFNETLTRDFENLKAQVIVRESSIAELMKSNVAFQNEIGLLQSRINELGKTEVECEKWKNMSVDLELQIQDLNSKIDGLEGESLKLQGDLRLVETKDSEIVQLKQANQNLTESCNRLHRELENKMQAEQMNVAKEADLNDQIRHQLQVVSELREENSELKSRIQKFQDQMKIHIAQSEDSKSSVQQHRRSKSDFDSTPSASTIRNKGDENLQGEIAVLKEAVENERRRYEALMREFQGLTEKETNARKEFERLRQHLIEVEDHYTEEVVENEKIINDLKSKLMAAEQQLSNSSTLYKSAKIRDNQHVESLQNQLRLVGVQRDDFQAKLSKAEDEIQKHKASLTSLQIVLEQFQQDKEREVEGISSRYEKQLDSMRNHIRSLESEIDGLQKQLSEAKTGLQAASRLGEQLERKIQKIAELEGLLPENKKKIAELEEKLKLSNQSVSGKVDKSLIKNLVAGYILSPNGDRKSQVLRILASVLDFDQEERSKMGVDASTSGWLASILHPKGGGQPTNESLSEAFIKFLESESRPQPHVNLLPDRLKAAKPRTSGPNGKPQGVFSELVLPTFNSPQESESSVILKNVLKDS